MGDFDYTICAACGARSEPTLFPDVDITLGSIGFTPSEVPFVPVRDHAPQPIAVLCPVCLGRCAVPEEFYDLNCNNYSRYNSTADVTSTPCRSCSGAGILWK